MMLALLTIDFAGSRDLLMLLNKAASLGNLKLKVLAPLFSFL